MPYIYLSPVGEITLFIKELKIGNLYKQMNKKAKTF